MFTIHFPEFDFKVKTENGKRLIFDIVRKKYVTITPEEWVRQHILHYLIEVKQYPQGFISVEHALAVNNMPKRCDVLVFNKLFQPALIIECKQPDIALAQNIFDQAGRYNLTLQVPYLAITNGTHNMAAQLHLKTGTILFLKDYPEYEALNNSAG